MNQLKNENENYFQRQQLIENEKILNFQDAIQYLDVPKSFLYKLTSKRGITFTKPNNGKIYFKKKNLDNWMLKNESKSLAVLENEVNKYLKLD